MAKPSHGLAMASSSRRTCSCFPSRRGSVPARQGGCRRHHQAAGEDRRAAQGRAQWASSGNSSNNGSAKSASAFCAGEELLRPFVLACNHADVSVKIGVMSLSAFQRLLSRGAVAVEQFPNIVRVLRIQSLSNEDEILLRILQTLPLILTVTEFEVPEDSLRQAVLFGDLGAASSPIIRSLASAHEQLLTVLYERVETSVLANTSEHLDAPPCHGDTLHNFNPTCTTPKAKAGPASPHASDTRRSRAGLFDAAFRPNRYFQARLHALPRPLPHGQRGKWCVARPRINEPCGGNGAD